MSLAVRLRPGTALATAALTLLGGCAIAAPDAANDPFFGEDPEGDLDASALDAAIDPNLVEPGPIDSGNVLPPFGTIAGATFGGAAGGTTGGGTTGGALPPGRDAGGGRDASTVAPRDAAAPRPPTTTRDASAPAAGCDPFTCTNECSVAGPFPCCTILDTCGCTWAPGAYCL